MVFAHAVEWDEDAQKFVPNYTKIDALMDYIMAGTMGIFPGDFDTFYKEHKQEYEDWYNKVYNYNYPDDDETIHGGGGKELTIKADDMQELYDRRCEKFYVCF